MNLREDDVPEVSEETFRYSGPKPQTKESAIISLADMVESASRSLEKPTPQKIEQLVNDFIDQRIADHQLDECDLTLSELRVIAERFRFTLMTMLHTRIAYPKQDTKTTLLRTDGLRPDVMAETRKPDTAPPISAALTSERHGRAAPAELGRGDGDRSRLGLEFARRRNRLRPIISYLDFPELAARQSRRTRRTSSRSVPSTTSRSFTRKAACISTKATPHRRSPLVFGCWPNAASNALS